MKPSSSLPLLFLLSSLTFAKSQTSAAEIRLAIVAADARCAVAGELLTAKFRRRSTSRRF